MKLNTVYCEGGAVYKGPVNPYKTKPERMVNQVELRPGRKQKPIKCYLELKSSESWKPS
jgi:hypothetical protein